MIINHKFDSLLKTAALCVAGAALLSACGDKKEKPANSDISTPTAYTVAGDHIMGSPDAPITVVEYASVTCTHCATWSTTIFPQFKKKFVDTGKVRYVFREFPTPPAELAMAGHLIANCAPEDKFFDIIHVQFKRQREILTAPDKKAQYTKLAKTAGVDFDACMADEAEINRLNNVIENGVNIGVGVTPTFIINGKLTKNIFSIEDFEKAFAETLGEPIPETDKSDAAPAGDGH